jgi:hypothetical protein
MYWLARTFYVSSLRMTHKRAIRTRDSDPPEAPRPAPQRRREPARFAVATHHPPFQRLPQVRPRRRSSIAGPDCRLCAPSAMVTFTRSLAGTSRNVRPILAPWIRFNARRVPTAAPLFWMVNGRAPDDIARRVRVGGQVASREHRASRGATPSVHGQLRYRCQARPTPEAAREITPPATAMPPTGSIRMTPLASIVASGTVLAPNVWPAAKSMMPSIARWLLALSASPRSPELSCFLHLIAPALARRTRPVLDFAPAPNSAPSWNALGPVN